ncbi:MULTISPECIES: hypothetical protein [Streptomyces]|uniref:hypothetical protein n=1 Tax=Streptomyces TaxID=1883 RepID=UPI00070FAE07|nr:MULTISPECIES: hypothetical protein [Streptomyces]KQV93724.1 hypothetical protein ASD08_17055 [Streptomyces sp. Root369]MCX4852613.1 hypothetical protein [Streptomyces canus]
MNPRKTAVAAALAALLLAGPGVAQAAPPAAPAPQEQVAAATITWTLERASNPTADQQAAYTLITSAMNAAVARYNNLSDLGKSITVRYDTSVPTADGNLNGTIRFGSNRSYMTERTALHEIAHTIGVGTSSGWSSLGGSGTWTGAQATALVRQFDGSSAKLSTGGGHFWPYGLNYENEFSGTAADRHVQIVAAMVRDGL